MLSNHTMCTLLIVHGTQIPDLLRERLAPWLSNGRLIQGQGFVRLESADPIDDETLSGLRHCSELDINRLPQGFDASTVRLVISDMDSTLIGIECIDEIADFLSIKPQVAAITESAMRGEIDFETSLRRRVALLAGLEASTLERVYQERLFLNPGAERLLDGLRAKGIQTALVSGGFTFFTDRLKQRLALDAALANTLEIVEGRLTGQVQGDIIGAQAKADFLRGLCVQNGYETHQTIALGDGANDLLMMEQAGLSVAYHAKPAVQARASCILDYAGLDGVLDLLGDD